DRCPVGGLDIESSAGVEDPVDLRANAAGSVQVFDDMSHRDNVEELIVERQLASVEINPTVVDARRSPIKDVDSEEFGLGIQAGDAGPIPSAAAAQVEDSPGVPEAGHEPPARIKRTAKPTVAEFGHRSPAAGEWGSRRRVAASI